MITGAADLHVVGNEHQLGQLTSWCTSCRARTRLLTTIANYSTSVGSTAACATRFSRWFDSWLNDVGFSVAC